MISNIFKHVDEAQSQIHLHTYLENTWVVAHYSSCFCLEMVLIQIRHVDMLASRFGENQNEGFFSAAQF